MKSYVRWVVLAAVVVLFSTNAWAVVWNPDTDPNLLFNMNFQIYDNGAHTTTDAIAALVGTVYDYNTTKPNIFGETSAPGLGVDANFATIHDICDGGAGWQDSAESANDVKIKISSGTSLFNLGTVNDTRTWAFWFNVPDLNQGTIIRHASIYLGQYEDYNNLVMEIRIYGGKMQFYHKNNSLRFETASSLAELGLTTNEWHSAAVVIDRTNSRETTVPTTLLSSKMYIDGLEVPVIVTSLNDTSMNIAFYSDPLWIGAGERKFNGLLDDVRLYKRSLTATEASILNQPDTTVARAIAPIPRSLSNLISTGVTWAPASGASTQALYFGTDAANLTLKKSGGSTIDNATNLELGGPFPLNTTYYWLVNTNGVDGPTWYFTTETGKALNPSPENGAVDVNLTGVDLNWNTPTAASYTVYMSEDRSLVENNDISVRLTDANLDPCVADVNTSSRGATYFWRVNCTYTSGSITGDIWSFRTKPYELVFNTAGAMTTYADHDLNAFECALHGDGWTTKGFGSLATDGVAVFEFTNSFSYDRHYDIIVVPAYRATDVNETIVPTPLAIHVTGTPGDFYFDGRAQLAGDDITSSTQAVTFARSGGYGGPKNNQDSSVFHNRTVDIGLYWTQPSMPSGDHGRFGTIASTKPIFIPTELCKSAFGPGQPVNPPYKGGGGGGNGGIGGEAGRGYYFGIFSGGPSYGDEEVPVPFGGSSGGWGGGSSPGGAAGGGGIEIAATGNVVLDSNSQIIANGGGQLCSGTGYPAGGGAGGSVKIIAGGSVTLNGSINVNGGRGGNGSGQANNTGGGGGGGRVAIFYTTGSEPDTSNISALGGPKGTAAGYGLALAGQNGTVKCFLRGAQDLAKKASAPTPVNGDEMVYCNPDPCTGLQLKWYSGYGATGDDVVYFGTNSNPTDPCGTVTATRGQHSITLSSVSSGKTYYWKVMTDGTVDSDVWSFKTVNWQCPFAVSGASPHVAGSEWDSNRDCLLNFKDFLTFGYAWLNEGFGANYIIDMPDLDRLADEWMDCYNRTDGGCAGF